ncbi:hypothetical protein K438DRAFT_1991277 [Mycena galopus ATCC 62051]|nr:hypothetical protein K438DRAFT_1991277 [Mycena galopus ATCC 62051]
MGTHSKTRKTRAADLFTNLTNFGGKAKRAWYELSPKKARKWLSPRKKKREDKTHDNAPIIETRPFDASDVSHDPIHDASHDPFDVSMQSFNILGFTLECPVAAPAAREFTWKLPKPPKPTVEEVDDEDSSTYTFPCPTEPSTLYPPSSPPPPSSSPPPFSDNDPLDSIHVPEADDELLATSLLHDDEYPRSCAPRAFLEHIHEQATHAGTLRQAPNLGEARAALDCLKRYMRGELRGTELFGLRGVSYKDPDISAFTRNRLISIRTMLNFYLTPGLEGRTYACWGASARLAALGLGRGRYCACVLVALAQEFILSREVLNVNPYGEWNESMLANEDLANDIRLHLQSLGKEITAEKLVDYLNSPEVRVEHGIESPVSLTTAR